MKNIVKNDITARGYTNVVLLLDMRHFIESEDQSHFEYIRGTREFAEILRTQWLSSMRSNGTFILENGHKHRGTATSRPSDDEIGFASGIFSASMLDENISPTYALNKEVVNFPAEIQENYQFKLLFHRAWLHWDIFIRPTVTGFFLIRLTQNYIKPRPLIYIATDIVRLQESLDVPSVNKWREVLRERYSFDPKILKSRETSLDSFLQWLGFDPNSDTGLKYFPVQWKIAIDVATLFVNSVGKDIKLRNQRAIRLNSNNVKLSTPFYFSYTTHHLEDLLAAPYLAGAPNQEQINTNTKIETNVNQIRKSAALRSALANLLDPSVILKESIQADLLGGLASQKENRVFFPKHRWSLVDNLMEQNLATLNDELCLITPGTAIFFPSKMWRDHEFVISTNPISNFHLTYSLFWNAVIRMIEFVLEINALAFVSERRSYNLLNLVANSFYEEDSKLNLDSELYSTRKGRFSQLLSASAHIRRIAGLCQGLSNPTLWSNSAFSISLAQNLLEKLGVPLRLEHIERNIGNLAEYIDLYRAEMSEDEDRKSDLRSIGLAAASLTLTLLMLPSFYSDTWQIALNLNNQYNVYLNIFVIIGTILGLAVLGSAFYIIINSIKRQR